MNYLITVKELVLQPSEFFKKMPKIENYYDPLIFAGLCNIPALILIIDINSFTAMYTGFLIGLIIRLFAYSAILHILWKTVGGTADFKHSFQIYAYSNVIELFAVLVGELSLLLLPYQIYIRVRGGQFVHNLGLGRSASVAIIGGIFEIAGAIIILGMLGSLY